MKRRLFIISVVVSLALGVALGVMWARSVWVMDMVDLYISHYDFIGASESGGLYIGMERPSYGYFSFQFRHLSGASGGSFTSPPLDSCNWHWTNFGLTWPTSTKIGSRYTGVLRPYGVLMPYWFALAFTLILPGYWLTKRKKHRPGGLCPKCGYDLRASTGKCPECGAAIAAKTGVDAPS